MSLWYTPPTGTFQPADSRTVGWSQLPNRKASFAPTGPDDDHPASSTGGGTLLDLGSSFNIKGPSSKFNFDVTMNYSNFQFQNVNDLTFNQFQFQQNVQQFMTNAQNTILQVITSSAPCDLTALCQRVTDLETWKATGAVSCGTGDIPVLEDWYYDPAEDVNNILKQRFRIQIQDGLITSFKGSANTSMASNDVTCTTNNTSDGLEPISQCPEGLPTPGVEFDEVLRIESIGT